MGRPRKWNADKVILRIKQLHNELGRRPVKRDNSHLYLLARQYYGTWNNALRASGYSVKDFQKPLVPSLTSELAYFIGLVITDGHLVYNEQRGVYEIRLYTSYPIEGDLIVKLIKKLFNYNVKPRKRKMYGFNKVPNYELILCSKKLVLFLRDEFDVPTGAKSNNIKMPTKLTKDKTLFFNFLRGLIDGDGSISNRVKLNSVSRKFLEQIRKELSKQGIITSLCSTGTTYELAINRKKHIKRLYNLLYRNPTFYYPRKKARFDTLSKAL